MQPTYAFYWPKHSPVPISKLMNWRAIIGSLMLKAGDSLPQPAHQVFADPFNYTLASVLQNSRQAPAALQLSCNERRPKWGPWCRMLPRPYCPPHQAALGAACRP